jgi:RHS repeat-associated protein
MVIRRNGWIYIYLSNQSNQDVFFDNLVVNLKHGPLVEQKVYYAFGIENPGLSTKAIKQNYYDNRIKYNGKELQSKEFTDGTGLEDYDYGARMYDPQIGRWPRPDNRAEVYQNISPYAYVANQPVNAVDHDGNLIIFINGYTAGDNSTAGNQSYWRQYTEKQVAVRQP